MTDYKSWGNLPGETAPREANSISLYPLPARKSPLTALCMLLSVLLSSAALAVALMHAGPPGRSGPQGAAGAQGETGPQGPAAPDPYGYICTTTNVPFNGVLKTAFSPCSDVNPNSP